VSLIFISILEGSLGAVMLGQTSGTATLPATEPMKELPGSRPLAQLDLPKKYR